MSTDSDDSEEVTLEEELGHCKQALSEKTYLHLGYHLATALEIAPTDPDALEMLGQATSALGEDAADTLGPLEAEGPTYFGTIALRAAVLARLGYYSPALWLLSQVLAGPHGETDYSPWLIEWMKDPRLSKEECVVTLCKALRSSGLIQESLEVAREVAAQNPDSHLAHIAHLTALLSLDQQEEALSIMPEALRTAPDENAVRSVRLDMGDALCTLDRWEEAEKVYSEVLEAEPEQTWAYPSALYCRLQCEENAEVRMDLEFLASEGNQRAQRLLRPETPFAFELYAPFGEIIPIVTDLFQNGIPPVETELPEGIITTVRAEVFRVDLGTMDPPSAVRSAQRELDRRNWDLDLAISVESIQEPDIRLALRDDVAHLLWSYEGTDPIEALEEPSASVSDRIAGIASLGYSMTSWKALMRQAAESDFDDTSIADLLATMVHPPPVPSDDLEDGEWTIRVQVAAALAIGALEQEWEWEGSLRREALFSLLEGPEDWTTSAAVLALTEIALDEPDAAIEIAERMLERLSHIPENGLSCAEEPLVLSLLRIPDLEAEDFEMLGLRRATIADRRASSR